ncbi:MAG: hypothetical protein SwBeaBPW_41290 [Shewanella algae]
MGKAKHNITNWAVYNRALVSRGSLTFWMDDAAIRHWDCQHHHGGRAVVSSTATPPSKPR